MKVRLLELRWTYGQSGYCTSPGSSQVDRARAWDAEILTSHWMMQILWGLGTTLCEYQGFANVSVSRPLIGGGFETLSGKGDCCLGTLKWQPNVKLAIHRAQIRKQTPLSAFDTKHPMMTFYFHVYFLGSRHPGFLAGSKATVTA